MFNSKTKLNTLEVRTILEYIKEEELKNKDGINAITKVKGCEFVGYDYHANPTEVLKYFNRYHKKDMQRKGLYNKSVNEVYSKIKTSLDSIYLKQAE